MISTPTHSAVVLTEEEELLVGKAEELLKEENSEYYTILHERFRRLRNLGAAVFDYPSIKETKYVRDILIDEHHLTESLLAFSSASHLLRIPSKIAALRSFLIAKFHAFALLSKLAGKNKDLHIPARDISFSIVFTLMAEEVYFSCLEDPAFSNTTKNRLADDLILLWDSGTDQRSIRHLMALSSLWTARDSSPPIFGTMDGYMELLRISINMDTNTEWEDFLKEESTNDETRWALEEFLFGLTYEEILQVRNRLKRYGVSAVNYSEVRTYLDSKPVYSVVNENDPRAIYDFFVERRDTCLLRKKVNAPGPLHTLEEIYLKYRIILEST
jgi:hypothetical protein